MIAVTYEVEKRPKAVQHRLWPFRYSNPRREGLRGNALQFKAIDLSTVI